MYRPQLDAILNVLAKLARKYEDDFSSLHGLGRLEILDKLLEGTEKEPAVRASTEGTTLIQVAKNLHGAPPCMMPTHNSTTCNTSTNSRNMQLSSSDIIISEL